MKKEIPDNCQVCGAHRSEIIKGALFECRKCGRYHCVDYCVVGTGSLPWCGECYVENLLRAMLGENTGITPKMKNIEHAVKTFERRKKGREETRRKP